MTDAALQLALNNVNGPSSAPNSANQNADPALQLALNNINPTKSPNNNVSTSPQNIDPALQTAIQNTNNPAASPANPSWEHQLGQGIAMPVTSLLNYIRDTINTPSSILNAIRNNYPQKVLSALPAPFNLISKNVPNEFPSYNPNTIAQTKELTGIQIDPTSFNNKLINTGENAINALTIARSAMPVLEGVGNLAEKLFGFNAPVKPPVVALPARPNLAEHPAVPTLTQSTESAPTPVSVPQRPTPDILPPPPALAEIPDAPTVPSPITPNSDATPLFSNARGNHQLANDTATQLQKIAPILYKSDIGLSSNGIGNVAENIANQYDIVQDDASQLFNSKEPYGQEVPTILLPKASPVIDPTKTLTFENGQEFKPYQLQGLQKDYPNDFQHLQKIYQKQFPVQNPVKDWLSPDEFTIGKKMGGSQFQQILKNPSINNLEDWQQQVGRMSAASPNPNDAYNGFQLSNKIQDLIQGHLEKLDKLNNTNIAPVYGSARAFYRDNVMPFRANPTLYSVATGNYPDAEPDTVLDAIQKGQRGVREYGTDPVTGRALGKIPLTHSLSKMVPDLSRLAEYKSNQDLTNLTEGRGISSPEDLQDILKKAFVNGKLSPDHPYGQLLSKLNKSLYLKNESNNLLNYHLSDIAEKNKSLKNIYENEMALHKQKIADINAQNKRALQLHKEESYRVNNKNKADLQDYKNNKQMVDALNKDNMQKYKQKLQSISDQNKINMRNYRQTRNVVSAHNKEVMRVHKENLSRIKELNKFNQAKYDQEFQDAKEKYDNHPLQLARRAVKFILKHKTLSALTLMRLK